MTKVYNIAAFKTYVVYRVKAFIIDEIMKWSIWWKEGETVFILITFLRPSVRPNYCVSNSSLLDGFALNLAAYLCGQLLINCLTISLQTSTDD